MEKDSTSFWADIKKYEDTLSRDPNSYCFAPLSEVYRKLGLLDDAIGTARRGVENHPEYIGGYMALGRAYYEKGMRQEARESLEKVTRATPENLLAQKLLSHIYHEEGNIAAAEQSLRTLVSFNPEDTESRLALEALQRAKNTPDAVATAAGSEADTLAAGTSAVSEEISEGFVAWEFPDAHDEAALSEDDENPGEVFAFDEQTDPAGHDFGEDDGEAAPLSTITLAELYEAQGYTERALAVYRELLLNEPENQAIRQRVELLQGRVETEETEFSAMSALDDADAPLPWDAPEAKLSSEAAFAENEEDMFRAIGRDDEIVETLEKWLDSIRRERACRSREL